MGNALSFLVAKGKQMATSGGVLNTGIAAWSGLDTYNEKRQDGRGKFSSFMSAAFETAAWYALPGTMFGLELVSGIPSAAYEFGKWQASYRRQLGREQKQAAFQSAAFQDTQATYTMRQAGMAIAERSRYNTQQAMLGHEANYMKK